jgi:hypothetical protein
MKTMTIIPLLLLSTLFPPALLSFFPVSLSLSLSLSALNSLSILVIIYAYLIVEK